ncbi:testis-specific expressed protein 55 isoform X2 [Lissotriton helveticus]
MDNPEHTGDPSPSPSPSKSKSTVVKTSSVHATSQEEEVKTNDEPGLSEEGVRAGDEPAEEVVESSDEPALPQGEPTVSHEEPHELEAPSESPPPQTEDTQPFQEEGDITSRHDQPAPHEEGDTTSRDDQLAPEEEGVITSSDHRPASQEELRASEYPLEGEGLTTSEGQTPGQEEQEKAGSESTLFQEQKASDFDTIVKEDSAPLVTAHEQTGEVTAEENVDGLPWLPLEDETQEVVAEGKTSSLLQQPQVEEGVIHEQKAHSLTTLPDEEGGGTPKGKAYSLTSLPDEEGEGLSDDELCSVSSLFKITGSEEYIFPYRLEDLPPLPEPDEEEIRFLKGELLPVEVVCEEYKVQFPDAECPTLPKEEEAGGAEDGLSLAQLDRETTEDQQTETPLLTPTSQASIVSIFACAVAVYALGFI